MLAATVAVTLHECGHAAMGLVRGLTPTLFSNAVSYEPEPGRGTALLTAAAGRRGGPYATSPHELRRLVMFGWLSGTAVVMVLTLLDAIRSGLPAEAFAVVLMGAVSIGTFAPLFTLFYGRFDRATNGSTFVGRCCRPSAPQS